MRTYPMRFGNVRNYIICLFKFNFVDFQFGFNFSLEVKKLQKLSLHFTPLEVNSSNFP